MFEKHRCARCSLRRRAVMLLSARTGHVPDTLAAVLEAICAARTPAAALNWLRTGAGAAILADLAAGRLAANARAVAALLAAAAHQDGQTVICATHDPAVIDQAEHVLALGG